MNEAVSKNESGMKWTWRLGRFAGIDVYLHATFLALIGWVILAHWMRHHSLEAVANGVALTVAIFLCVVLHEYGHALAARRFGIPTRDITLLPIGGVARLERMPDDPRQEIQVALAGPLVNVGIAALLAIWLVFTRSFEPLGALGVASGSFAERLLMANIVMVLFNLIPAFPMDGGRVLRAALALRMPHVRATRIASGIGQGAAVLFGVAGLFSNPFLILIAVFVWVGASQETAAVRMRHSLAGLPVRSAMLTDFRTLVPEDRLARAVELTLAGSQQDFPVVRDGSVAGLLTRDALLESLKQYGPNAPVSVAMLPAPCMADADEPLEALIMRLPGFDCHTVAVVTKGRLAGLVTMENIGELVMFHSLAQAPLRRAA